MPDPATSPAPHHSEGFGPAEDADSSRQGQHTMSNDAPTDVNMNSVVAREQASTFTQAGRGFIAAQESRTRLWDVIAAKVAQAAG